MPFFADIDHAEEKPHEAFDKWREQRRARRKALAHDRAAAAETPGSDTIVPSPADVSI